MWGRLLRNASVAAAFTLLAAAGVAGVADVAKAQGGPQDKQTKDKDEALRRAFERQKLDRIEARTREAFRAAIKTNERLLQAAISGSDDEKQKAKIAAGVANSNLERALAAQADTDPEVKRAKAAAEAVRDKSKAEYDKADDAYIKARNKLAERIKSDLEEGWSKKKQSQLVSPISSAAPGRSGAIAADGQGNGSFADRYAAATTSVDYLIEDIEEYAPCTAGAKAVLALDVSAARSRLTKLIEEAERTGQHIAARELRGWRDDLLDVFDEYSAHCISRVIRYWPYIEAGGVSQDMSGQVQRLAHEVGGNIRYDFGNVDQKSSGSTFRFGVNMPVYRVGNQTYFFNGSYAYSSLSSSASGGANGPFNIPGLGVGNNPNGFFTAANTPVSYQYDSDSNRHTFELTGGMRTRVGNVYISPSIGGNFGAYTVDDAYNFNRPSPPNTITGSYTTNSTAYTAGGYLGIGIDYRPPRSNVTFFGLAKAGVDYNWASSDVTFQLTSPLTEYQKVSISDTKVTPNLSAVGGLKFDFGAWDAYLKGGIQYGRYIPNVAIPGGGSLPVLNGETATEYSVMAGLSMDLSQFGKAPHRVRRARDFFFSDRRLKRDITQVGRLANGLKLYRYRYLWSDTAYVGVMAQEVALLMPHAVARGADGFLRVNYGRLGLRMTTWDQRLATDAIE